MDSISKNMSRTVVGRGLNASFGETSMACNYEFLVRSSHLTKASPELPAADPRLYVQTLSSIQTLREDVREHPSPVSEKRSAADKLRFQRWQFGCCQSAFAPYACKHVCLAA